MKSFAIVSDSSCDLTKSYVEDNNINIVPFSISFDSKNYLKENVDIDTNTFYKRLENGETSVKTSLPSIQDYLDVFIPLLKEGKDIVCLCLSSKFSGSYQSAVNAATIAEDDFPDAKIIVIDSKAATAAQGYIVKEVVKLREEQQPIDTIEESLQDIMANFKVFFTLDSLDFLARGGRIGKGAALAGTLLDIKPILFLQDGELGPHSKVRRRKKAISSLLDILDAEIQKIEGPYYIEVLSSIENEEALTFRDEISEKYSAKEVALTNIGVTIGVHTGPTALGFLIVKK